MSNVRISPEKKASLLEALVDGIDKDPAFQNVVRPPAGDGGKGKGGDAVGKEGIRLGCAVLKPYASLWMQWVKIQAYFGHDVSEANHPLLRRHEVGVGVGQDVWGLENSLAAVVGCLAGAGVSGAESQWLASVQKVLPAHMEGHEENRRVALAGRDALVRSVDATACAVMGYEVVGKQEVAREYFTGLQNFANIECAVDGKTLTGDKIVVRQPNQRFEHENVSSALSPLTNGLVIAAAACVGEDVLAARIGGGLREVVEFDATEREAKEIQLRMRTDMGNVGFGVEHHLAAALGYAAIGEESTWRGLFTCATALLKRDEENPYLVRNLRGEADALVNVLFVLNRCIFVGLYGDDLADASIKNVL